MGMWNSFQGWAGVVDLPGGVRVCLSFGRKVKRLMGTGPVITLSIVGISAVYFLHKLAVSGKILSQASRKVPQFDGVEFLRPPHLNPACLKNTCNLGFCDVGISY